MLNRVNNTFCFRTDTVLAFTYSQTPSSHSKFFPRPCAECNSFPARNLLEKLSVSPCVAARRKVVINHFLRVSWVFSQALSRVKRYVFLSLLPSSFPTAKLGKLFLQGLKNTGPRVCNVTKRFAQRSLRFMSRKQRKHNKNLAPRRRRRRRKIETDRFLLVVVFPRKQEQTLFWLAEWTRC